MIGAKSPEKEMKHSHCKNKKVKRGCSIALHLQIILETNSN